MKKHLKFGAFALLFICTILLVACSSQEITPTPTQIPETTPTESKTEETPMTNDEITTPTPTPTPTPTAIPSTEDLELRDLRVVISSDIHCTDLQEWYSTSYKVRMQHWTDTIKKEHKENPIDLLIINGDISLDYWVHGGSVINKGKGTSSFFVDEYLSQLPGEIEIFILPGNHEQYSDEDWLKITGNHRSGYTVIGGRLFIFLDNFRGNLDPKNHHDGVYLNTDVKYIEDLMAENPDLDVYLVAHYFDTSAESAEFKKLVRENDRIKGLFAGHTHKSGVIELGEEWGNKTIAQTGNFAYFKDSASESFWGFRELILTEKDGYSRYIISESEAVVDGVKTKFKRTIKNQVCYYGTAPELPKAEDPFEKYNMLYSMIVESSITGDEGMKKTNRVQLIFDDDVKTKWCVRPTSSDGSVTVMWSMTEKVRIDAYSISTANDWLDRNPEAWCLYGRNSEEDEWIVIDNVTNGNLPKALFTYSDIFTIDNPVEYKHYKLTVTDNFNNRDLYQFSELVLLQNKTD